MGTVIEFRPRLREYIECGAHANSPRCWTCGSCDFECPVNIATGRLRPQKIVRMANLGLLSDLINLPEIWYCIGCRRCAQICPNDVKPWTVIQQMRIEALVRCGLPDSAFDRYRDLWTRFQRVRWQAVARCLEGETLTALSDAEWQHWLTTPVSADETIIKRPADEKPTAEVKHLFDAYHTAGCFTCGECSSACPVAGEQRVFDPRTIFRMVNLGLVDVLVKSPSIWLCLSCQRCSDCCSQMVDGSRLVRALQEIAVRSGAVDPDFPHRLEAANRVVYRRLIKEIDQVLGYPAESGEMTEFVMAEDDGIAVSCLLRAAL